MPVAEKLAPVAHQHVSAPGEGACSGKAVEERMAREATGKTTAGGKEEDTEEVGGGTAREAAASVTD